MRRQANVQRAAAVLAVLLLGATVSAGNHVLTVWPGAVVPYEFDDSVGEADRVRMLEAMEEIRVRTSVRFVVRAGQTDWILIEESAASSSAIGQVGGMQQLRIDPIAWDNRFQMVHVWMHALGFGAEEDRPDRDQFVVVTSIDDPGNPDSNDNIEPRTVAFGPYDFESLMHSASSSTSRLISVLPPNESFQDVIGQRERLSDGDVASLQALYGGPACVCEAGGSRSVVDVQDLLLFLAAWFEGGGSDLDLSGDIGIGDLLVFLECWLDASISNGC